MTSSSNHWIKGGSALVLKLSQASGGAIVHDRATPDRSVDPCEPLLMVSR